MNRVIESAYIELEFELKPEEWKKITEALKKLKVLMKSSGKEMNKALNGASAAMKQISKGVNNIKKNSSSLTKTLNQVNRNAERSITIFQRISRSARKVNQDLDSTSKKTNKFFEFIKKAAVVTASFTLGKKSIETFASLEEQLIRTKTITGASDKEFSLLKETVETLGKKTQFSAKEVAVAAKLLGRSGQDVESIMKTLPGVLDLAIATEYDLASSTSAVTEAMAAFGETNPTKVADLFTTATNRAQISMVTLGADLNNVQSSAGALGVSLQDTIGLIAKLGDVGIKGGDAGTALNAFFTSIKQKADEGGKLNFGQFKIAVTTDKGDLRKVEDIFKDLAKNLENMKSFEAAQAVGEIFNVRGEKAVSSFIKMIKENNDVLGEFNKLLDQSGGSSRKAAKEIEDSASGSLARIQASMESILASIGEILEPVVHGVDKFLQILAQLASTLGGKVLISITSVTASLLLLASVSMKAWASIKAGWLALTTLIPALQGLNFSLIITKTLTMLLTWKFWLIAGAIMAVGYALYDLWKFFKGGDSFIGKLINKFQTWYETLGLLPKFITNVLLGPLMILWGALKGIFSMIDGIIGFFKKDKGLEKKIKVIHDTEKNIKVSNNSYAPGRPNDNFSPNGFYNTPFVMSNSSEKKDTKIYNETKIESGAITIEGSSLSKDELSEAIKKGLNEQINMTSVKLGVDYD